jgi:hypothetical protein
MAHVTRNLNFCEVNCLVEHNTWAKSTFYGFFVNFISPSRFGTAGKSSFLDGEVIRSFLDPVGVSLQAYASDLADG